MQLMVENRQRNLKQELFASCLTSTRSVLTPSSLDGGNVTDQRCSAVDLVNHNEHTVHTSGALYPIPAFVFLPISACLVAWRRESS